MFVSAEKEVFLTVQVCRLSYDTVNRGAGYETLKPFKSENNVVAIDVELTLHNLLFPLRTGLQISCAQFD